MTQSIPDTPDTLAARVFAEECVAYPEAVQLFAEKRMVIEPRDAQILERESR
ncbi:MAG: hypothetical protein AABZ12_02295 [Planctomycetota bacterium]